MQKNKTKNQVYTDDEALDVCEGELADDSRGFALAVLVDLASGRARGVPADSLCAKNC
jgi:hypothetical protein